MAASRLANAALLVFLFLRGIQAQAPDPYHQSYCSSQNTGSDNQVSTSQWMSNGKCHDICVENYAIAVVQYQSCWCSNYLPSDQQDVSQCGVKCPGYPAELCGNANDGLYGYVMLNKQPYGTAGASSAQQTSTSSQPPSSTQSTSTTSTSSSTSSSSLTRASSQMQSTPTPTPVTSTEVVTISGAIVTQTVTSMPAPEANPLPATQQDKPKKSVSAGVVAGVAIGSVVGVCIVAAAAFFLWRRFAGKRPDNESSGSGGMRRNPSVLSKAGLLTSTRQVENEKSFDDAPYPSTGSGSQRHSVLYGHENEAHESPVGAMGGPYENGTNNNSRRNSRPLVYDQRLNPAALMQNWDMNNSRASVNTMQDQRDYSRPLNVMNPDLHD